MISDTMLNHLLLEGELLAWQEVPVKVAAIVRDGSRVVDQLRRLMKKLPKDSAAGKMQVYWQPKSKIISLSFPEGTDEPTRNRWQNYLRTIQGINGVQMDNEWVPKDAVRVKSAGVLGAIGGVWDGANKAIGGPNPLTNTIAGGLLGAGLGYAGGTLAEQVLPEGYFERGKLRKMLAMVGAAGPIGYGLWKGTANARLENTGFGAGMLSNDNTPIKTSLERLRDVLLDERYEKAAYGFGLQMNQSGADVESIPVDAFNRAVWADVRMGATNPYGTKSPWGNNSQQLHTPMAVGAATTGIMAGIDARTGGDGWVSPGDIVRGLAGAGVGLVTANIAGKALGALAGLRPEAQQQLQQAGAFGGLLMSVVPSLFGR